MSEITHDHLHSIKHEMPGDYKPYGDVDYDEATARPEGACQCSCGCLHYAALAGRLGADWGVCTNPESHRVGLLTFEHQGCLHYEYDPSLDEDEEWME